MEKLQFLKKFRFQYSEFTECEKIQLCIFFVEKKHRYATQGNDVVKFLVHCGLD